MADLLQPAYTLTSPFHKKPYPAISPSRPELSQANKTVLIAGGSEGIGYAIARAFLKASAATVIILGRRKEAAESAAAQLRHETKEVNPDAKVVGRSCDMSVAKEVDSLWDELRKVGSVVDVLILNAAVIPQQKPILELGTEKVWEYYVMNTRQQMHMTERFYKQEGKGADATKVRPLLDYS
jgi:NAD(P)-dependent dehydrogenase (short-subunit alcohol dehydrogenase family)